MCEVRGYTKLRRSFMFYVCFIAVERTIPPNVRSLACVSCETCASLPFAKIPLLRIRFIAPLTN